MFAGKCIIDELRRSLVNMTARALITVPFMIPSVMKATYVGMTEVLKSIETASINIFIMTSQRT